MFIITLTYLRPLAELDALMPQHVAWLKEHYDAGLFIALGRQKSKEGGVIQAEERSVTEHYCRSSRRSALSVRSA